MSKPNILFFFTDDQRFDTLGGLGHPIVKTPVIDALMARGTTFTQAHVAGGTVGAICMPSRAMLHTGRTLFHLDGSGQRIPRGDTMLGEHLQAQGYRSFGTGKWHNGREAYARSFTDGAEIFFGGMDDHWNVPAYDFDPTGEYAGTLPQCPQAFTSNEVKIRGGDHVSAGKHSSELFADATIDFIEQHDSDAPFFAYLSFMAPHDPRTMPAEYLAMYDPEEMPLPENFMGGHPFDNGDLKVRDEILADFPRDPWETRRHIAEYYAMITHLDAQVGRVLAALEASGKADDTIIVFAGDNGLALGQHGLFGKQNCYEHSVRVPLIIAGPGMPEGARRDDYAYLLDIYPSLCDLLGIEMPASVEGQSLVEGGAPGRETLFTAYRDVQRMVKDGRYKLIEYVVEGRRTTQLFDLQEDPLEMNNLAEDPAQGQRLAGLREMLRQYRDDWDDRATEWGQAFWDGYEAG
ncbi:MAG: sulfatase-like hydrolase/transferase [Candidatus Latescibacteria bacterium]|nr:sulfatase-like hydrolase/transferase [Candidatus Latescibacterota bacterium]